MFNFFKTKIPKDNVTKVTIPQSWTLKWTSYKYCFSIYAESKFNVKVFINKDEALEYEKQLKECAKFINSTVSIELTEN